MAGFDDLIPAAMPYLAVEFISGAAGSTWQWDYAVEDDDENPVDLTTGYTGVCELRATLGGAVAIAPTVSFPSVGTIRVSADAATTAAVAAGRYYHEVEVTRTSDSAVIKVVGGGDGRFVVKGEVTE